MTEKKPSAEEIFQKNSEEMSDIERLMAEIIAEKNSGAYNVSPEEDGSDGNTEPENYGMTEDYTSPEPPVRKKRSYYQENVASVGKMPGRSAEEDYESGLGQDSFEDRNDRDGYGFDCDSGEYEHTAALSDKNKDNGKKRKSSGKSGKGTKLAAAILILCAVVVVGAILFKALSEDLPQSYPGARTAADTDNASGEVDPEDPENTLPPNLVIPTPEADTEHVRIVEPGTLVIYSDSPNASAATEQNGSDTGLGEATADETGSSVSTETDASAAAEHSYAVYREDLSWTAARDKCLQLGGHLANIGSQEELSEVIALAEAQGLEKLWIGCHRENAALIWENEEEISFYKWGKGEPSGYDSGDRVTEDFILLWKFNGEWVYNDSRDDPVKDYPAMYSGQIGYVCEFGD